MSTTPETAEVSAAPVKPNVDNGDGVKRHEKKPVPEQEEQEHKPDQEQHEQDPTAAQDSETQTSAVNRSKSSPSPSPSRSEGEYSGSDTSDHPHAGEAADTTTVPANPPLPDEPLPDDAPDSTAPPLPNEPLPDDAPPLPDEPVPAEPQEDDGWEYHWNPNDQSYWFYNRFTGVWQKENPRIPTADATTTTTAAAPAPEGSAAPGEPTTVLSNPTSLAGGYNPAIHGDYDENAWYAQNLRAATAPSVSTTGEAYATAAFFNRHTGQWQAPDMGAERHSDEAKARRQMRAFFDVDAAANMHDGRSLKAERAGIKPTKAELKVFKERRRQRKEEKRRAWLRD
ncbi:hypothetical protein VTJ49DRAFT_1755 [Mycothermus thermophilus]|uniref:WW domain-containing protein n=1 Tax=Humicola insolens TaxID=85995 RepID=A0ABR3VNA4_HUMIN